MKAKTIQVVVGVLGLLKKKVGEFVNSIPREPKICRVQEIVLTSTAGLLRKFLTELLHET